MLFWKLQGKLNQVIKCNEKIIKFSFSFLPIARRKCLVTVGACYTLLPFEVSTRICVISYNKNVTHTLRKCVKNVSTFNKIFNAVRHSREHRIVHSQFHLHMCPAKEQQLKRKNRKEKSFQVKKKTKLQVVLG